MAGKRRKKKKWGSVFWPTLFLTVAIGSVSLVGLWALKGLQGPGAGNGTAEEARRLDVGGKQEADGGTEETAAPDAAGKVQEQEELSGTEETAAQKGKYEELLADPELCRQQKIYAKETADPNQISIVFAGDILFDDSYAVMARMKQRGQGIAGSISQEMLSAMRDADIFMVNNEFPYTDRGEPTPEKRFTFRARPEYASYLLDMGADVVSLANNHASDYGEISLTDSMDVLDGIGMPFVGAGRNLEEAVKPVCFVANDQKIAILSATQIERLPNPDTKGATETSPGVFRCWDVERLLEEVRKAKQENDFVIVYIHWGTESTDQADWVQKEQAPQIAEAGADLIIGDHPHVLQGITYCGDTPVLYSLGNFLFNSKSQDTCLVRAILDENGLKSLQFIPGRQQDCAVTMCQGEEKERVLSYIRSLSPGVSIDGEGYISKQ